MIAPRGRAGRTKVAILVKLLPQKLGSMEDWLIQFALRLSSEFDVAVATYGPMHPVLRERLAEKEVGWHDLSSIERSLGVARAWMRQHADIAHFSLFAPRSLAVLAAGSVGTTRLVFQDCHSSLVGPSRASLPSRLLDRVTFVRTAKVVAVSHFVERRLRARFGLDGRKLEVVYNGVDVDRFQMHTPASACDHTVCVAALIPEKGVDILIRAFALPVLADRRLIICGDGHQRPDLEALASREGLTDRVEFLGLRDDVHRVIGSAALVVHPARWGEAFGLTIAESMAVARPVVGSRVGAVPELVEDGVTGLVIPPSDPPALADAIARLLGDPGLRDEMGRRARFRVMERFSMDAWVNGHVRIVSALASDT